MLRNTFAQAPFIELREKASPLEAPIPLHGLAVGGVGSVFIRSVPGMVEPLSRAVNEVWTLKVTKVGLLLRKGFAFAIISNSFSDPRKDDMLNGGKRSGNRKWKEWAVILTASQLLFFRDTTLATIELLQEQIGADGESQISSTLLHPEEILSLKDCVAVYDMAYTKVIGLASQICRMLNFMIAYQHVTTGNGLRAANPPSS